MTWLADTLLVTGLLIAGVLILRRPVARTFGAQAAYSLWLLPLLRLVLPPLSLPASWGPQTSSGAELVETLTYVQTAALAAPVPLWSWSDFVLPLWLAGAVLFLGWRAITYVQMRRTLLADALPMGEAGKVRLVESPAVAAPVAFGVLDKVVALPVGFMAWHDAKARDLALAHELAHHAGHDLLINLAAQPLLALHWFNPLAWAGWRAMRHDQEAACDARVLAGREADLRADYGRLIASLAGGPRLALAAAMACPVLGEKSIIHRLRSLTMPEPTQLRRRLGFGLIAGAALALPLTATIGYAAPDAPSAPTAPPAPPTAPAAPAAAEAKPAVKRIMIVESKGPGGDSAEMKTRTLTRDGKTITITSDRDITDAELDAKLAGIDAGKGPTVIMMPAGTATPDAPGTPRREIRRIMINTGDGKAGDHNAMVMRLHGGEMNCKDTPANAVVETTAASGDTKAQTVKIKICSTGHSAKTAVEGLKRARERIAKDGSIPAQARDSALKSLDEEIARMSKDG